MPLIDKVSALHAWLRVWPPQLSGLNRAMRTAIQILRDAEMTIKVIFERSSQKGGRQGARKEGQQGTHLEIMIVGLKHRKNSILESRIFIVVAFFPGNTVTIILDNYPPSTLQAVGLGGRKNPRIIVGENSCHFGASYKD